MPKETRIPFSDQMIRAAFGYRNGEKYSVLNSPIAHYAATSAGFPTWRNEHCEKSDESAWLRELADALERTE